MNHARSKSEAYGPPVLKDWDWNQVCLDNYLFRLPARSERSIGRRALKHLLAIALLSLPTVAAADTPSPQEHAAKFCPALGSMAYAIAMGRQEGVSRKELLRFAIDQGDNADLATEIVMDVWNTPIYASKSEREQAARHYGQSIVDACWAGVPK